MNEIVCTEERRACISAYHSIINHTKTKGVCTKYAMCCHSLQMTKRNPFFSFRSVFTYLSLFSISQMHSNVLLAENVNVGLLHVLQTHSKSI